MKTAGVNAIVSRKKTGCVTLLFVILVAVVAIPLLVRCALPPDRIVRIKRTL